MQFQARSTTYLRTRHAGVAAVSECEITQYNNNQCTPLILIPEKLTFIVTFRMPHEVRRMQLKPTCFLFAYYRTVHYLCV